MFGQELAAIDQTAQQFAPQPQMPPDNSMQVAQLGAQVQQMSIEQRAQAEQARLAQQAQLEQARMAQQAQLEQAKLAERQQERQQKAQMDQLREIAETQRKEADIAARERMNTSDNDTAKMLAAAEMATGEKVAISTGTGINPNP